MIISASRRTDIPAFYSDWLMHRLEDGYCTVPNPFNPKQISVVSLTPSDVDAIVFWTKNARPMLDKLPYLDKRGYRYYFQFTITGYPRLLEPLIPPLPQILATFRWLSERIGPARVIWRYDPIVFSNLTGYAYHLDRFATIASSLEGYTRQVVISLLDMYQKTRSRLEQLEKKGLQVWNLGAGQVGSSNSALGEKEVTAEREAAEFFRSLASIADRHGMEIESCAETVNLLPYGISPGKCIDDRLLFDVFGLRVTSQKDPNQRPECGCVVSKDIGTYDTCLFGCRYCYAVRSEKVAERNYRQHDPCSPSLVGWYDAPVQGSCSGVKELRGKDEPSRKG